MYLGSYPKGQVDANYREWHRTFYDNPVENDAEAAQLAIARITDDPISYLLLIPEKTINFWLPFGLTSRFTSLSPVGLTLIAIQFSVLVTAIIGLYTCYHKLEAIILASSILYVVLIHIVLFGTPRFNLLIMPIMIIFSSIGLHRTYSRFAPTA